MGGRLACIGSSIIRSLALVRPCLGLLHSCPRYFLPDFFYSFTIILVSASFSYFTLALPIREIYCVEYTPRAWDARSLQSILNGPLYFEGEKAELPKRCYIDRPLVDHKTNKLSLVTGLSFFSVRMTEQIII